MTSLKRKHILVVDDEEDILELVQFNLEREGFSIDCSTSGEEALIKATSNHVDLLILDLMLPGIDGLEVCRKLRNNSKTKTLPILMLSAKSAEEDVAKGLEIGADDYMTKPFSIKALAARVKALL